MLYYGLDVLNFFYLISEEKSYSLRALCKKIFNISDTMITKLEIPTGNPILIKMNNLKVQNFEYLDQSRAKEIITNQ